MKRRLNKKGKVLVTALTIMLSVFIYVLMAHTGTKATEGVIYQVSLFCGWIWLILGQISVYMLVWGE